MKVLPISLVALVGIVAAVSAQTDPSRDAFFAAIRSGSVPDVERLLKAGASPDIVDADGTPALMAATLFGGADLVKLLLDRGADPNRPGSWRDHCADVGRAQPGEGAVARRAAARM